jgi:hypothetical protein
MIRSVRTSSRLALVLAVLALAILSGAAGAGAHRPSAPDAGERAAAPAPSLIDVSATTQTPALFTVTGTGFTPGGRVYLAIYDQMGARLYETRWVTAGLATTTRHHEPGDGMLPPTAVTTPGGNLSEAFGHLCGANAMMRALDQQTATWSNWLPVRFACAGDDPHPTGRPS